MKNKDKDKDKDVAKATPTSSPLGTGLIAFDDLDRWFDNLLSRRWLQSDWKFPNWPEREFALSRNLPKVDIIGHDNEIKVQAALSGVKKRRSGCFNQQTNRHYPRILQTGGRNKKRGLLLPRNKPR